MQRGRPFARPLSDMKHLLLLLLSSAALVPVARGQFQLVPDQTVPVDDQGNAYALAWAGGLNSCQFSTIDMDQDGTKDLFIFDRVGNKVIALINGGTNGQVDYTRSFDVEQVWPFNELRSWALMRDYNCDGKEDIFTYSIGGFAVYKNISDMNGLAFELVDTLVRSNYVPTNANLFVTQVDLPGIVDIDGDGDLDVITFSIFGSYVEYHKNLSMELYGTCDSLEFQVFNRCWGYFSENLNNNSVTLNNPCNYNVTDPEMELVMTAWMEQERAFPGTPGELRSGDGPRAHVGSTVLPIDLDGDDVMDLVLGDVSFNTLTALGNGGTVDDGLMVTQDTLFPVYDEPTQLPIFPAGFYEDVNNDGKRDLLVSPNATSLSQNYASVWYYLNSGTDAAPVFTFQQGDLFQDEMIELGSGAYPVPFDHDQDGLMDLLVANAGYFQNGGNYPCKIALFRNTGTATSPAFTLETRDYMNLSTSGIGQGMYPALGDLDGDGDMDMYIGDLQGRLHFYKNVSTTPVADFVLTASQDTAVNGIPIDVGQFATPQLFDINGDGLLDLLIGERNGNVNYYRNTGPNGLREWGWTLENDSIGDVLVTEWLGQQFNVTGYSVPVFFKNLQNETELLVGSESGWIYHYGDIDGNLGGTFTRIDSTFQGIKEGWLSGLAVHDWTGNGQPDLITGNYRGGLTFWRNDFGVGLQEASAPMEHFRVYPNPALDVVEILLPGPAPVRTQAVLINALGQEVLRVPVSTQRTRLDIGGLEQGLYIVRLMGPGMDRSQRLIIAR